MLESEDKLIELLRGGDRDALGQWLNTRRGPLLAFIERRLGAALRRKVDPDDLLQEVNTEAVRCFGEMDLSQRDPFGWLCQIAERRIIDAHRRFFGSQKRDAGREVPLDAGGGDSSRAGLINLLVASMTTASQAFSRDQRDIRLQAALEKLPAEHREALRMRVYRRPAVESDRRAARQDRRLDPRHAHPLAGQIAAIAGGMTGPRIG